jgi:PBP1b-binding outer membrane lipoprotein LpoB
MKYYVLIVFGLLILSGCAIDNPKGVDSSRAKLVGQYISTTSPNLYIWNVDGQEYIATEEGGLIKHEISK